MEAIGSHLNKNYGLTSKEHLKMELKKFMNLK